MEMDLGHNVHAQFTLEHMLCSLGKLTDLSSVSFLQ